MGSAFSRLGGFCRVLFCVSPRRMHENTPDHLGDRHHNLDNDAETGTCRVSPSEGAATHEHDNDREPPDQTTLAGIDIQQGEGPPPSDGRSPTPEHRPNNALIRLFQAGLDAQIFQYLTVPQVLKVCEVCPAAENIVRNHFVHKIVPKCYAVLHTKVFLDGVEEEPIVLYTVVRNVSKEDRVFPKDNVVFEPDYTEHRHVYRRGEFVPSSIVFWLEGRARPFSWDLVAPPGRCSRYEIPRGEDLPNNLKFCVF